MFEILKSWWNVDRIRSTPGHYRLLMLKVEDRVLIRDRLWIVSNRQEDVGTEITQLHFALHEPFDSCKAVLKIEFASNNPHLRKITLCEDQMIGDLLDNDLIVLANQDNRNQKLHNHCDYL